MNASAAAPAVSAARRLVLVPAAPGRSPKPDPALRRYRLARVAIEGREVARRERFSHLKRSYD
ncbi:MAG: hypothetical protein M3P50_01140 [Actinomycetota bacterium]|nr:hypothetical protein [Actinomycetota bacterium]